MVASPILLVSGNDSFAHALEKQLRGQGHVMEWAKSVYEGLLKLREQTTSLVLIDRSERTRGDLHGDLVDAIRKASILLVSIQPPGLPCRDDECLEDLIAGSDAVICTESYREMAARIRALLRRQQLDKTSQSHYEVGPIRMNMDRHEVTLDGRLIDLTLKEFQILHRLMEAPDRVYSRQELLNRVWGVGFALEEHTLDVHVYSLRQKLEPNPSKPTYIQTIRGVGYKLQGKKND